MPLLEKIVGLYEVQMNIVLEKIYLFWYMNIDFAQNLVPKLRSFD